MSQENVEIVRSLYEHWESGDFRFSEPFDPEVTHTRTGAETPGFEGEWRGLEGLSSSFAEYLAAFSDLRIEAERMIDLGDDRVLVFARHIALGKLSGAPSEHELADLFTLHNGEVVRYDSYWDRAKALQAAGLSE